jgi:type IV fimbrial biogenesis protein FimT
VAFVCGFLLLDTAHKARYDVYAEACWYDTLDTCQLQSRVKKMKTRNPGFTLIEFLIVSAIATILLVFSIPQFEDIYQRSHNKALLSQLLRIIKLACSTAIMTGKKVILCNSRDQKTCSGNWQDGYVVLSGDKVVFTSHSSTQKGSLHWRAFPFYLTYLEFLPSGLPNFQNGTFWYCSAASGKPVWAVMLSQSGRAREVYPEATGDIKDEKDKALNCLI